MRAACFAAIITWSVLAVPFGLTPAAAEKRVALVIGNSKYAHVTQLQNPANDARLIADTLRDLGFSLIGSSAQLDLDKVGFDSVVQQFGKELQDADVGLFYYSGHGLQVRGANYLVPVGANPTRDADVDFQMLDANLVLRQMEGSGTKLNIVIVDACRNSPFGGRGLRSTDSGLAQMQAPEGTLISFATQPGTVAQDGADGNSPYTKALVQTIRKPGINIFRTFNEVGLAVTSATSGAQQPWVSASPIKGEFYFAGPIVPPVIPSEVVSVAPPVDLAARARQDYELVSKVGTKEAWEQFLSVHGESTYATLARQNLAKLEVEEAKKAEEARKAEEAKKFEDAKKTRPENSAPAAAKAATSTIITCGKRGCVERTCSIKNGEVSCTRQR